MEAQQQQQRQQSASPVHAGIPSWIKARVRSIQTQQREGGAVYSYRLLGADLRRLIAEALESEESPDAAARWESLWPDDAEPSDAALAAFLSDELPAIWRRIPSRKRPLVILGLIEAVDEQGIES